MLFHQLTEVLDGEPHDGALNMAIDEVLLEHAAQPTLRIYQWKRPAVSFGYFGKVAEIEAAWPGRERVRRWTGGGIVPHGEDLTYTLLVPRRDGFFRLTARESYRIIHERLAEFLAKRGTAAQVAASASVKISDACFENAVQYDLVTTAGKIAGGAQRRTRAGLLHQGSIQCAGVIAGTALPLAEVFTSRITRRPLSQSEMEAATELAARKYATEAWLRKF